MGRAHSRLSVTILDGQDISAYCNNVAWSDTTDTHETTTFGMARKRYDPGNGDGSVTISGFYDNTAITGPDLVIPPIKAAGELVPFLYQIEGTGSGKPQKSVSVLVTKYNVTSAVNDMVMWTAELQMSGELDETPQAA